MTKKEFSTLKKGDGVHCRATKYSQAFATEVLDIDRMFGKVSVLLKSKPLSYRYISRKYIPTGFVCGTVTLVAP